MAHRREVVAFYKAAGIDCLVIWENEVRKNPKQVAARLLRFVTRWQKAFEDEPPEGDVLRFFS